MANGVGALNGFGQSPWYDNLTRTMLRDGGLARLVAEDGIRGVTSNPTIFEKAMAAGEGYDEQLLELHGSGASTEEAFWALVVDDIAAAAEILRPVYEESGASDGYVSVEVSPRLAHDTDATVAQARELTMVSNLYFTRPQADLARAIVEYASAAASGSEGGDSGGNGKPAAAKSQDAGAVAEVDAEVGVTVAGGLRLQLPDDQRGGEGASGVGGFQRLEFADVQERDFVGHGVQLVAGSAWDFTSFV